MNVKRIIITTTHQTLHKDEDVWTYLIPMNEAYAKINNIPFQRIVLKSVPEDRFFSWAKIPVLHTLIQSYDEILFISENAAIINQTSTTNVFDFIKSAPIESKWPAAAAPAPIMYALSDKSSQGNPLTGIFLFDCRDKVAAKEFLNDWWNDLPNNQCRSMFPYEQAPLLTWKSDPKKAARIRVADVWSVQEFDKDQVFIQLTSAYKNIQVYEAKKYMFRLLNNKRKKVGIFVRQNNFYCSGAGQNCIFIQHSLEAAGYTVDLLVDYDSSKSAMVDTQIPYLFTSTKNINYADYSFILYGWHIPSEETRTKIRELGIKTAMFHPMNSLDAIHNDHFIHDKETSVPLFEENFQRVADEVWLTQNHDITYRQVLEIQNKHKIPVRVIPLSWAPLFTLYNGKQYTYKNPESRTIDLIIMEPNMSYWKSAWMPLVLAEAFYMKHKERLNKVYLFGYNGEQADAMIRQLSIFKDSKLRKIGRMPINEIIKFFCYTEATNKVAVISHNIQCPLNYAYFDVMNAGLPFLHNSSILEHKQMGYMYKNIEEGVGQLECVLESHNPEKYKQPICKHLAEINPYSENVIKLFEKYVSNKKIHTLIVSTQDKTRVEFMEKQLKTIQYPFSYQFFKAHTPENSQSYLNIELPNHFRKETANKLACGLRSHIDALHTFLTTSSADYVIILEDDICFRQDIDIQKEIIRYIQFLESSAAPVDYISFSYRPYHGDYKPLESELSTLDKHNDHFYCGFSKPESIQLWGAQAYIMSREKARKIVDIVHKSTLDKVVKSVETHLASNANCSRKGFQYLIDSVLPIILRQCIVYPMLAVETHFAESSISYTDSNYLATQTYRKLVKCDYYPEPSVPVPTAAARQQPQIFAAIVSTMNKARHNYMIKQMTEIQFPYKYEFFKAFTQETSASYFDTEANEPAVLILCMRSHIGAMEMCLRTSDAEYFLIMEDDVAFQTSININNTIQSILETAKAHPEIDYVSLSYIPTYLDKTPVHSKLEMLKRDKTMYWGFDNPAVDFTIWGSQAYLISRQKAQQLVSLLHHSKLSEVKNQYKLYLQSNKTFANKTPHTTIDAIMPFILNQAIMYPMICVEKYFPDSISNTTEREKEIQKYCKHVNCTYYSDLPAVNEISLI